MPIKEERLHEILGEIYECAISWHSEDADRPDPPPPEWDEAWRIVQKALDVSARRRGGAPWRKTYW